jgi:hypothetical protein
MKVKRQDDRETNKITAFWLYEFAHDLDKKATTTDYLKEYLDKNYRNKKFSTIEEKLADIKERVGFNIATKIVDQIEKNSNEHTHQTSASKDSTCKCKKDCSCSVKTASHKQSKSKSKKNSKSKKDIKIMDGILSYIEDMIKHEPHLDPITVLDRCRSEEGLKYNSIRKKINHDKLMSFINDLLSSNVHSHEFTITYVPSDSSIDVTQSDSVAEYYNHAEPKR